METVAEVKTETWEEGQTREKSERDEKINVREDRFRNILRKLGFEQQRNKETSFFEARIHGVKDDASITLQSGDYIIGWDRVRISGGYPRNVDGQYVTVYATFRGETINDNPITVSFNKTDDQIVKDIERRFLPDYNVRLGLVLLRIAADKAYNSKISNGVQQLKAVLTNGKKASDDEIKNGRLREYLGKGFKEFATIEVKVWADRADVVIDDLTVDQDEAVIRAVQKLA